MQYGWNKSFLGYVLFDMCGLNMDLKASCYTIACILEYVLAARLTFRNTIMYEVYGSDQ